jgi:hypothetical protein
MKRDMDLIRLILRKVEASENPYGLEKMPQIDGYSLPQISYHTKLLCDAGLIEAHPIDEMGVEFTDFMDMNLTWAGQEFLDATKDDSLWKKAKETIIKPGASFTFDLLLSWLKAQVATTLGLP